MTVTRVVHQKLPALPPGVSVSVGFFPGAKYEDGTPVAGVAAVHEFGIGVPARPFMRPTIAANAQPGGRWSQAIVQTLESGKTLEQAAHALGNFARGDIQAAIAAVTSPPLSLLTLQARKHRKDGGKVTGKTLGELSRARDAGPPDVSGVSTKPLVDTRIMLPSVQYEVSK